MQREELVQCNMKKTEGSIHLIFFFYFLPSTTQVTKACGFSKCLRALPFSIKMSNHFKYNQVAWGNSGRIVQAEGQRTLHSRKLSIFDESG